MAANWSRCIAVSVYIEATSLWYLGTSCLTASQSRTPGCCIEIIRSWYNSINSTTVKLWKPHRYNSIIIRLRYPKQKRLYIEPIQNDTIQLTSMNMWFQALDNELLFVVVSSTKWAFKATTILLCMYVST